MSNIVRFSDLNKKQRDEDNKEGYSNVGATSSTMTVRPQDSVIQDIVASARGSSNNDPNADENTPVVPILITLHSNGFFINDGPFMPLSNGDNQHFLEQLRAGVVPPSLENYLREHPPQTGQEDGTEPQIKIQLHDLSSEPYPRVTGGFNFASSQGHSLIEAPNRQTADLSSLAGEEIVISEDEQSRAVVVQIELADRRRVRVQVLATTTIEELYRHVTTLQGVGAGEIFTLFGGFPPKELSDPTATIAQLKLANKTVKQRK